MMQGLVSHAARESAVTDDGDDLARVAFALRGERHAERSGDRRRRVTDAECVVLALVAFRKWSEPIFLLDGRDAVAAAGQDLVRIALMTDVPHQAVGWRVVQIVERDGQFHDAEPRAEMPADSGDRFDQVIAQLARDVGQFAFVERAQVGREIDAGKARVALWINHLIGSSSR